ncbi:MATE family efflux transporter [Thalassospira lucentensis]|uniref:MATE family efflux transporter n=1 Tax=Thalassospira lucentensis TaxID=168935 RepID=UPI003D2EFD50
MFKQDTSIRPFKDLPLIVLFAKIALPVVLVMGMNGMLSVVDAIFLGMFVGADAVGAVTLIFPFMMLITALAALVGSGMSSLLARYLGAGKRDQARTVFAGAHGLSLLIGAMVIIAFVLFGQSVMAIAAGDNPALKVMAYDYLTVMAYGAPLMLLLAVNSDTLRNEGRAGLMAVMSLFVTLANIALNWVLIAKLGLGVSGSALGTVGAQVLALLIVTTFRLWGKTQFRPGCLLKCGITGGWRDIIVLGVPTSLSMLGIAMGAGAVIAVLQIVDVAQYASTVAAYGIITRIMTFAFLPVLALAQALQSITGHNYGAGDWQRANDSLKLGIGIAFGYCLLSELVLVFGARPLGLMFVDDPLVIAEVERILPVVTIAFFLVGPLMMVASYFQAIGDAGRAALLNLAKPYAFALPLTFVLPQLMGEPGIWLARPAAEVMLLVLTGLVLLMRYRVRRPV